MTLETDPSTGEGTASRARDPTFQRPCAGDLLHPAATALLLGIALFLLFGRLGSLPLIDPDEGRNAGIAREMAESGAWLVPTYNGLPYLDKPALYFKMVALSLGAFGINETAARLPSALFGAALLLLVYVFCRQEYGTRTATLAVAIVAAMPLFLAFSRMVIFDIALAFFVSFSIVSGYRAMERKPGPGGAQERHRARLWWTLSAAAAGFATLTKGPVGFMVPALVLLVLAVVERRRGVLRAIFHPLSLATFLVVVLPWFVGVSLERPDFPYYGLVKESLERFTQPSFSRPGPFYYYLPVTLAVCFGWSVLFPGAARLAWRARARLQRADRLLLVWAITVLVFFSLSQSKLPGYVLTAVVALGTLTARLFSHAWSEPTGRAAGVVFRGAIALAIVTLPIAAWLGRALWIADGSALGFEADVPDTAVRAIAAPLVLTMVTMSALALFGRSASRPPIVLAAFLVFPLGLLTVSFSAVKSYANDNSSIGIARELQALPAETKAVCFRCFPKGLGFYLGRTVFLISDDGTELRSNYIPFYLSREPEWPPQVVPVSQWPSWLETQQRPLLILAPKRHASALEELAAMEGRTATPFPRNFVGLYLERP